ncbi:hypothetical protein MZD04_gp196 [Pseudomonas phage Psa21]|uniref:Virion structural protein n=1 Tax=Pseudomonas phage Psa21 TaxID=2530023 RepID=A0A481W4X4_9CAUD|nr:hypothetical protein MZD04_gp196 [Pseudomonas phage Psa21]QBJ02722.1 hypothetical protein PSA21_196 [Pseudomonas phage Psa21]
MLIGYVNNELVLAGVTPLTSTSTGAEAIAAIYKIPSEKQNIVFQKDFTTLRKKDSYKYLVLSMAVLAVLAGLGFAGSVAKLEGESAAGVTDVFKVLISGLFEIAKLLITGQ